MNLILAKASVTIQVRYIRATLLLMSNYETAKNHMKSMKKGDLAFFYHSNCKMPGVAGIMEVVEEATVDGKSDVDIGADVCRERTD